MRAWFAASAAAVLLARCGIAASAAHGADGDIDVRLTAQRLAAGRTEFALQQRQLGGEWGDRLLPRLRFFPATTTTGRWLVSSPLTIAAQSDSMSAATTDADLSARIAAQRLADGAWSSRYSNAGRTGAGASDCCHRGDSSRRTRPPRGGR